LQHSNDSALPKGRCSDFSKEDKVHRSVRCEISPIRSVSPRNSCQPWTTDTNRGYSWGSTAQSRLRAKMGRM